MRVTVVDHGAGNLRSLVRALEHVGADVAVTTEPSDVATAARLVLPGQGAFSDCMRRLRHAGLDDAVRAHVAAERPYLGICLGLQVLFERGQEHGTQAGLGVLRGEVLPLERAAGLKIPHMGWNQVRFPGAALPGLEAGGYYYFVHSYHVVPTEPLNGALNLALTEHGALFVSAVRRGALWATQFHPEKSHRLGLALLGAWLADAET